MYWVFCVIVIISFMELIMLKEIKTRKRRKQPNTYAYPHSYTLTSNCLDPPTHIHDPPSATHVYDIVHVYKT